MGEGQDTTQHPSTARVGVQACADRLDMTLDAIRNRLQRHTIAHEKDPDGRMWILLNATGHDMTRQDNNRTVSPARSYLQKTRR